MEEKKELDVEAAVGSIFNNEAKEKEEEKKKKDVKKPVNIFSRPIDVTQSEAARKSRLKGVIIEGLLFGAFLTAITAIYSLSGLDLKLDPENAAQTPNIWFFLIEFIAFSVIISVGNYFLTEKRVNDYNQSMAGLAFDIDDEIKNALEEQARDGISTEEAAAQNKSDGVEAPKKPLIEIKPGDKNSESLTDKAFEAFVDGTSVGRIESCKGVILDTNNMETVILSITALDVTHETYANGVAMELMVAVKSEAAGEGFPAVAIKKEVYGDLEFNLPFADKFGIKADSEAKIAETYPGALMNITGELKI